MTIAQLKDILINISFKMSAFRIILSKLGASYLKLYRICRIRNVAPNSVDFGVSFNLVTVKLIRNWLQAGSQIWQKIRDKQKMQAFLSSVCANN